MRQSIRRLSVVLVAGAAVVLGIGGIASAHVTAHAPEATPGGDAEITFTVPTESDTASTVRLQVQLPKNPPLASVNVKPVPGWTATTTTTHLAQPIKTDDGTFTDVVSQITWTAAAGQGIAPGQYQDFAISVSPLPKSGTLVFPMIQTYSDDSQVAWIDPTVQGQPEPEHPAPTIAVAASGASDTAASSPAASGSSPSGLAVAGVVLGAAGLVAALAALAVALRGNRRRAGGASSGPAAADRSSAGALPR